MAVSLVATGFPTHKRGDNVNIHYYWHFTLNSHGVRRDGSAALDLCSVACGRFEAFWEFGLKSWDTAAGILIVSEAGGKVTDLRGGPYRPGGPDLLVTNGHIHAEMQQMMAEIPAREQRSCRGWNSTPLVARMECGGVLPCRRARPHSPGGEFALHRKAAVRRRTPHESCGVKLALVPPSACWIIPSMKNF